MISDLLINIHELSKNTDGSDNEFSSVKDLSALFGNSDVQKHHRFWFKSDIIRLIANMCYNHQEHQNLVGTYITISYCNLQVLKYMLFS